MIRSTLRTGLAIAGAAFLLAAAGTADANKAVALPTINIVGTDSLCTSFTTTSDGTGITLTCVTSGSTPPAGAPTNCAATVNGASSVTLPNSTGGSVNLAVTCTGTTTGYSWSRNGAFGASTAASWTDNVNANTTSSALTTSYTVQVCNGTACVNAPNSPLTVIVPAGSAAGPPNGGGAPPSGGSGFSGSCPGFGNTIVMNMNWANPARLFTSSYGAFGPNDVIVVVFTTGNVASPNNSLPRLVAAEYQSPPSTRIAVLSTTACDFSAQLTQGATTSGTTVTVPFTVANSNNYGFYPILNTNTTYYLNIKNAPSSSCTSSGGDCDMAVDLNKPSGI